MKKCNTEIMKDIKQLELERNELLDYERDNYYVEYTQGEKIISSDYDYKKVQMKLEAYDTELRRLRGLLAYSNVTTIVDGFDMTISEALFYLNQLKYMENRLRQMVNKKELTRKVVYDGKIEYKMLNFKPSDALEDYTKVKEMIPKLQMAIDRTNLTNMIEC